MSAKTPKICAILLAAGSSTRMGFNKMLHTFCGRTPLRLSLDAFSGLVDEAVVAVSQDTLEMARSAAEGAAFPVKIVLGGERRQDSVYNALINTEADVVAIHDCARCLVAENVIKQSIESAISFGSGVACVPVHDTLRDVSSGETIDRSRLSAAQTPQSFLRQTLLEAYSLIDGDALYTDDAAIFYSAGNKVCSTPGDRLNMKLTSPDDIPIFEALIEKRLNGTKKEKSMRIGFGEDTHRLVSGRKLILGGVDVPFEFGLDGHSDADVLTHAVIDALLGAAALADIGQHFPDNDPAYKGINSLMLAERAASSLRENGYSIVNIDSVIIAQRPKLASFRDAMRKNLAVALGIAVENVSVKFTTPEHTGPEGRGESMTCRAAALIE